MKKLLNKTHLFAFALILTGLAANAQGVNVGDIRAVAQSQSQDFYALVRIILTCICFGGLIYVVSALIAKRETSKGVVIGWIGSMIVWGVAEAVLALT